MKKSFLDCRLLHLDYDKHLVGEEKRKMQIDSKNRLLSEFIKSFALDNAIIKDNKIVADNQTWHFSTTHARGTTMVYFAKWESGIDCIATIDIPGNWQELANKHFTKQELEWLDEHSDSISFAKLWTAKESLFKCYFNIHGEEINFNEWKLESKNRQFIYSKNKESFVCSQGTSDDYYIFFVCEKE